jgi:hypothetical protein
MESATRKSEATELNQPAPKGATSDSFTAIASVSRRPYIVVESSTAERANDSLRLAEEWNGSAWTILPNAQPLIWVSGRSRPMMHGPKTVPEIRQDVRVARRSR